MPPPRCVRRPRRRARPAGAPRRSEVEPDAVVEDHAARRGRPRGQLGHPRRVVGPQPPARVRQQHATAQPPDAAVEELRVRRAVRGAVVEQQHALGERHRPRGPGDDGGGRGHREQPQHVEQHLHVPAGHHQRRRAARQVRHGGPVLGDHIALARPPRVLEGRTGLPHPGQVLLVDEPDDGLRVGPRRAAHGVVAAVPRHLAQPAAARRRAGAGTAPGARAAPPGAAARRRRSSGSRARTSCQRACSRRFTAAAAEQRVELGVVGLRAPPSRPSPSRPAAARSSAPTTGPRVGRRCGPRTNALTRA